MTPGHRIGGESERFGWIYVPPPPPRQAYQYTSRQVLNQHRISGESECLGRLYLSPLPTTTPPIHITPGLKSTSDWWHTERFGRIFTTPIRPEIMPFAKIRRRGLRPVMRDFRSDFCALRADVLRSRQLNGEKPVTERCVFTQWRSRTTPGTPCSCPVNLWSDNPMSKTDWGTPRPRLGTPNLRRPSPAQTRQLKARAPQVQDRLGYP